MGGGDRAVDQSGEANRQPSHVSTSAPAYRADGRVRNGSSGDSPAYGKNFHLSRPFGRRCGATLRSLIRNTGSG
jgi:hypothetical protein